MKNILKRFGAFSLSCLLMCATGVSQAQAQVESGADDGYGIIQTEINVHDSYASLSEMMVMVSEEAIRQFNGFFHQSRVTVEPFSAVDEFGARSDTILGTTLRDQMTAAINNSNMIPIPPKTHFFQQYVKGVIQEIDGLLRIHIKGMNAHGYKRSYVVNVEMSEPIYRALHSFRNAHMNK
ncbi:MAG: hypothetical protein U9O82_01560 [Thermodesulfobacteriota bacterium]|nr:hypothetical protein [Thermodesulfobacteriota bacterium]